MPSTVGCIFTRSSALSPYLSCVGAVAPCWQAVGTPRQPSELMPPWSASIYSRWAFNRVSHSHAQVAETTHGPKAETAHGPKLQRQHTAPRRRRKRRRRRRRRRRNGIMCCPDRNGAAVIALATGVATANDLPSAGCVCMCGSAFTSEWCSRRRAGHNFGVFFEQLRVWTGRSMARY